MKEAETPIFFDFSSRFLSSTVQAHSVDLKEDENGVDDQWNLIKGIYKNIHFPVAFKQEYGKKLTDILGTGWPSLYLISDKFKGVLEENSLTGWQTFLIKLYDKRDKEIPGYHGFSMTGRCGPPNYDNSEIIERRWVTNGPICTFYKGVSIENWDGSDFFTPEGTYETFTTKRVADVLKKNKITNFELINLLDYEIDVDNVPEKKRQKS